MYIIRPNGIHVKICDYVNQNSGQLCRIDLSERKVLEMSVIAKAGLLALAAVLLLPLLLGIDGIWLAVTAAELAALLVSIGLFITRDQQFHYRKAE